MEIFLIILLVIILLSICHVFYEKSQYKKTTYYQITKNPYSSVKYNRLTFGIEPYPLIRYFITIIYTVKN